jgi:hypothetical protein
MNKCIGLFIIIFLFVVTSAFSGPFGIEFGMTLEQIKQISKTEPKNVENDYYIITPPNTNDQFEIYVVCISPKYGVYIIRAISKAINSNVQGTALKSRFNDLVLTFEKTYGKYKKEDFVIQGGSDFYYFMYSLSIDERVLMASWGKKEGSKLPQEMLAIYVKAKATNNSTGYLLIEYYSQNYEKIKAEQESVF